MPVHNWKNIDDGIFHDFHCTWITAIKTVLNGGLLPPSYYALAEQRAGEILPDVLALQIDTDDSGASEGGTAVLAPPQTALKNTFKVLAYVNRQNSIMIRHASNDRIAAVFEIVSRGNKIGRQNFKTFLNKARSCLDRRIHFSFVDVHAPGMLDPHGIHGAICLQRGEDPPELPAGKILSDGGYEAGELITGFINPFGVGELIPPAPLFLKQDFYVMLPLEETYSNAYASLPRHLREKIERNSN